MARWEPNANGRLTEAAMALFAERGYANTTVADIAARAGLTERTFFNHFADKREVLFAGSEHFVSMIVEALRAAPADLAPLDAVVAAYKSTSDFFQQRRAFARKRAELIAAHPELQERELIKMMSVAAAVREVLQQRGASPAAATLAAEAGTAILRVGFEQWVNDTHDRSLAFHLRAARRQLDAVVSPAASRGGRAGTRATSAGAAPRSRSRGDRDR